MADRARPNLKQMASQVLELLEPELVADGYDLLDVRVFQGGGRLQVRIYVDLPAGGINLSQCAKAGRSVNMLMEEADLFAGQYVLEVSSPGVRRPLRTAQHFSQALGQRVDLKVRQGFKSRRVRGELTAMENQVLWVQPPAARNDEGPLPELEKIPLKNVQEGNLDPEFDVQALINADRRQKKEEKRAQRQARKKTKKSRPRSRAGKNKESAPEDDSSPEK